MRITTNILFLVSSTSDHDIIVSMIKSAAITGTIHPVGRLAELDHYLTTKKPHIILLDHDAPGTTNEALNIIEKHNSAVPVILLVSSIRDRELRDWLRKGVEDFVYKDNLSHLRLAIVRAITRFELLNEKEISN